MTNHLDHPILSEFSEIDKLIHEPARLAVMALLYVVESADFTFIINQTGLTYGNLSAHISKLESAGYVELQKGYKAKRPNTTLKLTPLGRKSFNDYVRMMQQMFGDFPTKK